VRICVIPVFRSGETAHFNSSIRDGKGRAFACSTLFFAISIQVSRPFAPGHAKCDATEASDIGAAWAWLGSLKPDQRHGDSARSQVAGRKYELNIE